jgi:hypothetical protein
MKPSLQFLFAAVVALFLCQAVTLPLVVAGEDAVLTIDEVLKNVDPATVNKAEVKEYYKEIGGRKVRGEGTVVNIFPGTQETIRIAVLTSGSAPAKGYNVMLYVSREVSPGVEKNDRIAFEGEISRLSAYKGALIDIQSARFRKIEAKQ